MKTGFAGLVATLAVVAFVLGVAAWGCASQNNAPIREHDWQRHEPDGGWGSYVPAPTEVEPMGAAASPTIQGVPTTTPVNPSLTTFH